MEERQEYRNPGPKVPKEPRWLYVPEPLWKAMQPRPAHQQEEQNCMGKTGQRRLDDRRSETVESGEERGMVMGVWEYLRIGYTDIDGL
jgi:hypothetical protein